MDISELKQQLLDKKLNSFYVFTGPELALQDIYIKKIQEISGLPIKREDALLPIFKGLTSKGLFAMPAQIYVIRNDEDYFRANGKWSTVLEGNYRGSIVIMLYSYDKMKDFEAAHKSVLVKFDKVNPSYLKNRLNVITGMPLPYCDDIVKMCSGNYGRIQNELHKLQVFAKCNNYNWESAYLQSKKVDLIHEDIGDIIFDFTGAVEKRNIAKAYNLWPKMKYTGDGTIKVLSVLYNSFRQILMVQSTPPEQRTEPILGLTKGQIFITAQKCNVYNLYELVNIVKTLRYIEKGIKTGTVAEDFAMEYFMGTIW